jgi:hypothetical protein
MGKIEQPLEYEIKHIKLNKKGDEYLRFPVGITKSISYTGTMLCYSCTVRESLLQRRTLISKSGTSMPRFWQYSCAQFLASVQRHGTRLCMYPCILGSNNCVMFLRCVFSSGEWPAYVSLLCFSDRLPIGIDPCQLPLHHAAEYLTGQPVVHSSERRYWRRFLARS